MTPPIGEQSGPACETVSTKQFELANVVPVSASS